MLNLQHRTTLATTTIRLSSRPIYVDASTYYYPILKSVDEVGSTLNNYVPSQFNGSITLEDSPNSFGFQRKFSDLLQRYNFNTAQLEIYEASTSIEEADPTSAWSISFKGISTGYTRDPRAGTLTLRVQGQQLPRVTLSRVLTSSDLFGDVPNSSLGAALPLVFGDYPDSATPGVLPQVKPVLIHNSFAGYYYAKWAVSTRFNRSNGNVQFSSGAAYWYARDATGKYCRVASHSGAAVGGQTFSSANYRTAITSNDSLLGAETLRAERFVAPSTGAMMHRGYLQVMRSATATLEGQYTFEIWKEDPGTGGPGELVGRASVDKSTVTHANSGDGTAIYFTTTKPVPLDAGQAYWFAFKQSSVNGSASVRPSTYTTASTATNWVFVNEVWTEWVNTVDGNPTQMHFQILSDYISVGSGATDANGLGFSSFDLLLNSAGTVSAVPNPSDVDWIVDCLGYSDVDGDIIGAGDRFEYAEDVAKLLTCTYDGTEWTNDLVDDTIFSDTHVSGSPAGTLNEHKIRGVTVGRVTPAQLLSEIMRAACSNLVLVESATTGKYLAVWSWGVTNASQATLTDEDSRLLTIDERGPETIVNEIELYYDKRLSAIDLISLTSTGVVQGYAGVESFLYSASGDAGQLIANSHSLYGRRPLGNAILSFGGAESARTLRDYLTRSYPRPQVYVTLEAPAYLYRSLKIMNVIDLLHPDLPAFFGSSASARYPHFEGTDIDLVGGRYWKRSQRYRAQIESRSFRAGKDGYPLVKLECRLLLNSPLDPT